MKKDRAKVAERIRSRVRPEEKAFVTKNMAIANQISLLLKEKGITQKELSLRLGKTESELSRMLSGLHNLTLKSITNVEAAMGCDIIITPDDACERYSKKEYVYFNTYVSRKMPFEKCEVNYVEEESVKYQKLSQNQAV